MDSSHPNASSQTQCLNCRHLIEWPYCFAFLTEQGIPYEIRNGVWDHSLPYAGDHGVRFVPLDSPYQLSEEALKRLIAEYRGGVIMPLLAQPRYRESESITAATTLSDPPDAPGPTPHSEIPIPLAPADPSLEVAEAPVDPGGNAEREVSDEALLTACARGELTTIAWLLDHGAPVDAKDSNNNTALMVACRNCHVEVVRLLLQRGADVNAQDNYSRTAMDIASDWGYPSIINLLREHGGKKSEPVYR